MRLSSASFSDKAQVLCCPWDPKFLISISFTINEISSLWGPTDVFLFFESFLKEFFSSLYIKSSCSSKLSFISTFGSYKISNFSLPPVIPECILALYSLSFFINSFLRKITSAPYFDNWISQRSIMEGSKLSSFR